VVRHAVIVVVAVHNGQHVIESSDDEHRHWMRSVVGDNHIVMLINHRCGIASNVVVNR
jgi:hypothetical protein